MKNSSVRSKQEVKINAEPRAKPKSHWVGSGGGYYSGGYTFTPTSTGYTYAPARDWRHGSSSLIPIDDSRKMLDGLHTHMCEHCDKIVDYESTFLGRCAKTYNLRRVCYDCYVTDQYLGPNASRPANVNPLTDNVDNSIEIDRTPPFLVT